MTPEAAAPPWPTATTCRAVMVLKLCNSGFKSFQLGDQFLKVLAAAEDLEVLILAHMRPVLVSSGDSLLEPGPGAVRLCGGRSRRGGGLRGRAERRGSHRGVGGEIVKAVLVGGLQLLPHGSDPAASRCILRFLEVVRHSSKCIPPSQLSNRKELTWPFLRFARGPDEKQALDDRR